MDDLLTRLRRAGVAEASSTGTDRALYSSDGSLFRQVPTAVVWPRNEDEVAATMAVARATGTPITARGAGTSLAGNAVGTGIVLDFSRHMNAVLSIDPGARSAWVQAGTVHATLQAAATAHGLRFGPDPSTHTRCTIGGMIGNNACGPRAMGYGRTSDNVLELRLLLADGSIVNVDGSDDAALFPRLKELVAGHLALVRTECGRFGRQVSGYQLENLLPENGFDARRAFAGTEGSWGIVLAARVRLVQKPAHTLLVALGYPDMAAAADDVPTVRRFPVVACEGMGARMLDRLKEERGADAVPPLPAGEGWSLVEVVGETAEGTREQAEQLIAEAGALEGWLMEDAGAVAQLWKIRADAAGLVSRTPDGRPAHAGWEDSAVPPERLGDYIRELETLLDAHGLYGLPYGHFGDGCLHMRVDFPLERDGGRGVMRAFMLEAAALVARFGGSVSGEHGDGRARGELLKTMYSPEMLRLFAEVKRLFDPQGLMNPGIIVDPPPFDADIRLATVRIGDMPPRGELGFTFAKDQGDFGSAVHRCTGVAKCRADMSDGGGTMCPSYLATGEELHSTRGRARILQEMVAGTLVERDWAAPEVHEALDLCLSCKACSTECPTGVDMATYKAEVLHQTYRGRLRPRAHYSLGWLPLLARVTAPLAGAANRVLGVPAVARLAKAVAGVDSRRRLPTFATPTFTHWFRRRRPRHASGRPSVVLFADTWGNYFTPRVLKATLEVLEGAGVDVRILPREECCGLTFISTGQLDQARASLGASVAALDATEGPIIGVEPSCTATLREEAVNLLGTAAAGRVAGRVKTLAEYLLDIGYRPPDLSDLTAVVQPHCHQAAVLGFAPDAELLARSGITTQQLSGCCGLAGNFGVEQGHYEVSEAVAGIALTPALGAADASTVVLADGYSCRTQIGDLSSHDGVHLAELLAWGASR